MKCNYINYKPLPSGGKLKKFMVIIHVNVHCRICTAMLFCTTFMRYSWRQDSRLDCPLVYSKLSHPYIWLVCNGYDTWASMTESMVYGLSL